MPPSVFSTLTWPMTLSEWDLTFLRSSRLAGMTSRRVDFRSGSEVEAKVLAGTATQPTRD